jgi:hypothetical protein
VASSPRAPAPIVRSAKLDKSGLTIQFSEPVRAAAEVDPNKFRLTFAYYSKSRPGTYSYYYEYYGANRALTVYSDVGHTALKTRVEQPDPTKLRIPASAQLDLSAICAEISSAPSNQGRAGLYLHYSDSGAPGVESAKGARLESIAPYWLTGKDTTVTRGSFEGRPIPVSVSCR